MKMRCVVTGGAGFIGSNLALELERQGHEVIIFDNLFTGTMNNLKQFKGEFVNTDISKPFEIEGKIDVVFHQAAITDPRYDDDDDLMRQNMDGFHNCVELAQKKNAKLVYASSASLYGNGSSPQKEDQEKDLMSAYAKSKIKMDQIAETLFDKMHIVGLRYFNVFGPGEAHKGRPASMIYHLTKQMNSGKVPRLFKYGEQKRDHIYVKDCVFANFKALECKSGVYNVGTGIATSFNQVIDYINKALGTDFQPEYIDNPYEGTYQDHTQADTTKAETELKFKTQYSTEQGVLEYVQMIIDENNNGRKY